MTESQTSTYPSLVRQTVRTQKKGTNKTYIQTGGQEMHALAVRRLARQRQLDNQTDTHMHAHTHTQERYPYFR